MTEAIIVASIGALASVICQVIISNKSKNLTVYRLDLLEEKVQKHNNFIERLTIVEQRCKSNQHRLDEMEGHK